MERNQYRPATPICYSLSIHCGMSEVIEVGFNTNSYSMVIEDLQRVIRELKQMVDPEAQERTA